MDFNQRILILQQGKSVVAHFTHEEMMRHAHIKRLKEKDDIERLQMEEEKQKKHKRRIEKMQKNYTPALESATSFLTENVLILKK